MLHKKSTRRVYSFLLILVLLFTSLGTPIRAQDPDHFIYETIGSGIRITGLKDTFIGSNVVIPDEIEGQEVTEIADRAFFQRGIESLTLGQNIHTIGNYAFAANSIASLEINAKLKYIGEYAFRDNKIKSLDTKNIETISEGAFTNNGLESLVFGGIKHIGDDAFSNNKITEVSLGDSLLSYGRGVFASNDQYVLINTQSPLVKTEVIPGAFGQVVNPVTITVSFIDTDTKEKIISDEEIGLDFSDLNGIVVLNSENTYQAKKINGYQAIEEEIKYIPDSSDYNLIVEYKNLKIKPTIEVVGQTFIEENGDGSKEHLLTLVKAYDLNGNDISDRITVSPESVHTSLPGPVTVTYQVMDDIGNISTLDVTIFVGPNWFEFPIGNDWVLGDFTYDGNKVTGFSETGLIKVATQKDLILPHINPNDGVTVIDTVTRTDDTDNSFRNKRLTSVSDYADNIKVLEGEMGPNVTTMVPRYNYGAFTSNKITNVDLPSLEYIGRYAFATNNITKLNFPNLEKIAYAAFSGNPITSIEENDLPKVVYVDGSALSGIGLEKVHMPGLVEIGGSYSFGGNQISEVSFPKLEIIGTNAFANNQLTEVTPSNFPVIKIVGGGAFRNNKITKIDMPTVVTLKDGAGTFNTTFGNNPISEITDNFKSLENIGAYVFYNLSVIEELNIPNLRSVGFSAFTGNVGSSSWNNKVVIWTNNDSVPSRENYLINPTTDNISEQWEESDFTWDIDNPNKVTGFSPTGLQKLVIKNHSVTIPPRATIVGDSAFEGLGIKEVYAPNVEDLEYSAFYGNSLTNINDSFPNLKNISGTWALGNNKLTDVKLDNVETVAANAFRDNSNLVSVSLESVKEVGERAFSESPITSLYMPQVLKIGKAAFWNHKLTVLDLPMVEEIGISAFARTNNNSSSAYNNNFPDANITGYQDRTITSVNLPKVKIISDLAFAGNKISSLVLPSAEVIARRAFFQNSLVDLILPKVEEIGTYAFGNNKLDEAYVSLDTVGIDSTSFYNNRTKNASKRETMIFIPNNENPNNLQDGYVGTTRQHIINPTKVTVNYVDAEGEALAESFTEFILKEKTYNAIQMFLKVPRETSITVPDNRQHNIVNFVYDIYNPAQTGGVEIGQSNEHDYNTGNLKTRYYIGELMTSKAYVDVTGMETEYRDAVIKIFYDPKYMNEGAIKVPIAGSIKSFKAENGALQIKLDTIQGGYQVEIPIEWRFNKYVTPDNYQMILNILIEDKDGNIISVGAPITMEGYYNKPQMLKRSPLNLPGYNYGTQTSASNGPRLMGELGQYVSPENKYEYKLIDPYPVKYNFSISGLERNIGQIIIKDTLPTYLAVKENGEKEERKAVFDQSLNPAWTLDTATGELIQNQSFPATRNPMQYVEPLYLSYPDLASGYNVENTASIELVPYDKGSKESNMTMSDSLSIYTGMYKNVVYDGDPRFEKEVTAKPRTDGIQTYFYDAEVDKNKEIPFMVRLSSMAQNSDLKDLTVTDYGLDERLYYYGIAFSYGGHTAGDLNVDLIAYKQVGEKMDPSNDTILYSDNFNMVSGDRHIFPEHIARDIDYIQIVLPADHKLFSAIQFDVLTKLRNPDLPIFDSTGLSGKNYFENHALMAGNLYQKGTENPIWEREKPIVDSKGVNISSYSSDWDNIPGNYLWGAKDMVFVRDSKLFSSIDKTQSYPSSETRIVYPGEAGTYTLSVYNYINDIYSGYDRDVFEEDLHNFRMIDLMPVGVSPTAVHLSTGFMNSGGSYRIINDFNSTGRTAIEFTADVLDSGVRQIATINSIVEPTVEEGFISNEVYATFDNSKITKVGTFANPPGITEGTWLKDHTSMRTAKVKEMYARKFIKKAEDSLWSPEGVVTKSEGLIDYRLYLVNNLDTPRTAIDIVDVFPYVGDLSIQEENIGNGVRPQRNSEFANTYDSARPLVILDEKGIDISAHYKIQYWNSDANIDYQGKSAEATFAGLAWSTGPAANTKAVRIKGKTGTTIQSGGALDIRIPMKAPKNTIANDYDLSGKKAWNSYVRDDNQTIRFIEPNKVYNTLAYPTGSVSFVKYGREGINSTNYYPLAGAEFILLDENDTELAKAVSDQNGRVEFTDIPIFGSYRIKETKAPEGYEKKDRQVSFGYQDFKNSYNRLTDVFHIDLTDKTKEDFLNTKPIYGSLTLEKVNAEGEKLPYIKFNLQGLDTWNIDYNKDFYTSEVGTISVTGLLEGRYKLTEISNEGKTGFVPIAPVEFVINAQNRKIEFTGNNALVNEQVRLVIYKLGLASGAEVGDTLANITDFGLKKLDGYSFKITEVNNPTNSLTVGVTDNGYLAVEGLSINTLYEIEEIENPGTIYKHNPIKYRFLINSRGQLVDENANLFKQNQINFPNFEKDMEGRVEIVKFDDNMNPLEGAEFALYNKDTLVAKATSSLQGGQAKAIFEKVKPGTYTLKELSAPEGYTKSNVEYTLTIPYRVQESMLTSGEYEVVGNLLTKKFAFAYNNTPFDIKILKGDKVYQAVSREFADVFVTENPDKAYVIEDIGQGLVNIFLPLEGVIFDLYEKDSQGQEIKLGSYLSNSQGYIDFKGFTFREDRYYVLREVKTLEGYRLDKTPIYINLPDYTKLENFNGIVEIFKDNKPIRGRIIISKYDEDARRVLEGATFELYRLEGQTKTLLFTASTNEKGVIEFRDLDLGSYSVREKETPQGYQLLDNQAEFTLTEKESSLSYVFNNPRLLEIVVKKVWQGSPLDQVSVSLLADDFKAKDSQGNEIEDLLLNEANNWKGSFTDLPKYDKDGKEINYSVLESPMNGYSTSVEGNQASGFTITNTELIDISGVKTWDDVDNQKGKRPSSITIRLLANGVDKEVKTVTEADEWKWTFDKLPKYESGQVVTYSISEDVVEGYTSTINGYNVTNKYTPGKTSVQVTKSWQDGNNQDGIRPESVTIKLLADGQDTGKTLVLTEGNKWTNTFVDLDEYKGGKKIVYTVKEETVGFDYESKVSGDQRLGYIITNTRIPEVVEVIGKKTWEDSNNEEGKRPTSITIRLLANGVEKDVKTVTEANKWIWTFDNLPKYESGQVIIYSISEDAVEGYTSTINGYNVTNVKKPEITEVKTDKKMPRTGERFNSRIYAMLLLLSSIVLLFIRNKKRKKY